jgi:hypothetical protein
VSCNNEITMSISLHEVQTIAGIDQDYQLTKDELAGLFIPASVDAFGDGEILSLHGPLDNSDLEKYYGKKFFRDGIVTPNLRAAAIANGRKPGTFTDYQRYVARVYVQELKHSITANPVESGVMIHDDVIAFDDYIYPLNRTAQTVVDYGPGLAGLSHTKAQSIMVLGGEKPYRYLPISRLPFTNQVLAESYDAFLGPGSSQSFMRSQYFLGREDGIASATNEIVEAQTRATGTTEVADAVLASGLMLADKNELKTGIFNSFKILKEGGVLVIRAVALPSADEVGASRMLEWAHEAGFDESKTKRFEVLTGSLGAAMVHGSAAQRQSISAVLTK